MLTDSCNCSCASALLHLGYLYVGSFQNLPLQENCTCTSDQLPSAAAAAGAAHTASVHRSRQTLHAHKHSILHQQLPATAGGPSCCLLNVQQGAAANTTLCGPAAEYTAAGSSATWPKEQLSSSVHTCCSCSESSQASTSWFAPPTMMMLFSPATQQRATRTPP
jgi:hypothetical protein